MSSAGSAPNPQAQPGAQTEKRSATRTEQYATAKMTAALLALATSVGFFCVAFKDSPLPDVLHSVFSGQDPREQKISDALRDSLGIDVTIRCVAEFEETDDETTTRGETLSMLGHTFPYIRLAEVVCDAAVQVPSLGGADGHYSADPWSDPNFQRAVLAVKTIAHEGSHYKYGVTDERIAECYGIQLLSSVAERLGASPEVALVMGIFMATNHTQVEPPSYYPPPECREDDAYDLAPGEPGIFPAPIQ